MNGMDEYFEKPKVDRVRNALKVVLDDPTGFPGTVEMIKALGKKVETPDFTLPYRDYINQLIERHQINLDDDYLFVITQEEGQLEKWELSTDNENKEIDYPDLQERVASSIKTECYILSGVDWNILCHIGAFEDIEPVEDQLKRFANINTGKNVVTEDEAEIVKRYQQAKLYDRITEDEEEYTKKDLIRGMVDVLDWEVHKGNALNYRYLVEEFLKILARWGKEP